MVRTIQLQMPVTLHENQLKLTSENPLTFIVSNCIECMDIDHSEGFQGPFKWVSRAIQMVFKGHINGFQISIKVFVIIAQLQSIIAERAQDAKLVLLNN